MEDNMIVKGYNGVMDLDLSSIDPKFHKEVIQQHYADIEEYKADQKKRPPRLRYENAMVKSFNVLEIERKAIEKRRQKEQEALTKKYKEREELFYKRHKQKKHDDL